MKTKLQAIWEQSLDHSDCLELQKPLLFPFLISSYLTLTPHVQAQGFFVDLRDSGQTYRLKGLFMGTDLAGMLEASDCEAVDIVFPFLGAVVDDCCGLNENCYQTTAVLSEFKLDCSSEAARSV